MQDEPTESPRPKPGAALAAVPEPGPDRPTGEAVANPAWANDLRKLYNAVVEEPLPDSFIDLLSQLDSED